MMMRDLVFQQEEAKDDCNGCIDLQNHVVATVYPSSLPSPWGISNTLDTATVVMDPQHDDVKLDMPPSERRKRTDRTYVVEGSMDCSFGDDDKADTKQEGADGRDENDEGKIAAVNIDEVPSSISSVDPYESIPPVRLYQSDLEVILDLDQCLIHSEKVGTDGSVTIQTCSPGDHSVLSVDESKVETFDVDGEGCILRIHLRPFVQEFLQVVSSRYKTHLFTAGTQKYADPIVDRLDPTGSVFTTRRYRTECTFDQARTQHVKDLTVMLPRSPCSDQVTRKSQDEDPFFKRVVHVDNCDMVFLNNLSNGILVRDFYNDHNDYTLLNVLYLLDRLDSVEDVRPLLTHYFDLPHRLVSFRLNWLQKKEQEQEQEQEQKQKQEQQQEQQREQQQQQQQQQQKQQREQQQQKQQQEQEQQQQEEEGVKPDDDLEEHKLSNTKNRQDDHQKSGKNEEA